MDKCGRVEGNKPVTFYVDEDFKHQIKLMATTSKKKLQQYCYEALKEKIERDKKTG